MKEGEKLAELSRRRLVESIVMDVIFVARIGRDSSKFRTRREMKFPNRLR
jgi:hypothetical protein